MTLAVRIASLLLLSATVIKILTTSSGMTEASLAGCLCLLVAAQEIRSLQLSRKQVQEELKNQKLYFDTSLLQLQEENKSHKEQLADIKSYIAAIKTSGQMSIRSAPTTASKAEFKF